MSSDRNDGNPAINSIETGRAPPRRRSPPVSPVGIRVTSEPVRDVPEHFFDVIAEAVDEGAAGVEHRERPAEVEARHALLPDRRDAGVPLLPDVDRAALDRDPAGAIPRGAHDPVERLPHTGGECRRPVRATMPASPSGISTRPDPV